uniref:NADH-ubiquinone oxidoreductase chain 5 n=1 Tax=Lachesilla anna TaxID=239245 RepID=A0A343QCG7_9NEOP|nr:NADH dehydrogenase subunit 5 [Lachesilla anna]ATU07114.1 NADH dehydrogenase subunit 5 [Lachesilla anna]
MKSFSNYVFGFLLLVISMFCFVIYVGLCLYKKSYLLDFEVVFFNSSEISFFVLVDWMSTLFVSFVCLISFVVVYYSKSYMGGDKTMSMFIFLIFCFVMSMMLLIISPNLISILLGWDGLGLISYCLVIYYQNMKSYNAGMLTALTNRIGDVMILLSIAWMMNFGSWNFSYYFFDDQMYLIISLMIVVAAMTKSAQIPFSSWLPAAMAAPTPVSALVHSSTLVTAGVYLLIRFSPVYLNFEVGKWLLVVSVLTMFMSGVGAIYECDLKKIIALSTLSQLGLMVSALSIGLKEFAFFHLLSHALFKSLLFMCAGYIIHGMNDSQDIRFMGSVVSQSPLLSVYFNISNLSLCGMPFLSGFFSKDLILEYILFMDMNLFIYYLYFLSIIFTVVYSFRLVYYSMVDELKLFPFLSFNDNDVIMLGFMTVMMLMTIFGGCFVSWMIFIDFSGVILPIPLKTFVLNICIVGGVAGLVIGGFKNFYFLKVKLVFFYNILMEMWFLPYLSTFGINWISLKIGGLYSKVMDSGWGEYSGGQGLYKVLIKQSLMIHYIQLKNLFFMLYIYMLSFLFIYFFMN